MQRGRRQKTLKKKKKKEEKRKEEHHRRREGDEFNLPPGRGSSCGEAQHHSGAGGHCVCIPVGAGGCWLSRLQPTSLPRGTQGE